jgi:hypothetical protein
MLVSFDSHMTGVTSRAERPSHSGTSDFISVLVEVHIAPYLLVVFCISFVCLFVLFLLTIVLSVLLRFMVSNYPCGIFKLFLGRPRVVYDLNHKTRIHTPPLPFCLYCHYNLIKRYMLREHPQNRKQSLLI